MSARTEGPIVSVGPNVLAGWYMVTRGGDAQPSAMFRSAEDAEDWAYVMDRFQQFLGSLVGKPAPADRKTP